MATTPRGIKTPEPEDPWNLIPDLDTMAQTTDDAIGDATAGNLSPHEEILALAEADGWLAVFDPSNPATLTEDGPGNVTAIADGLGNLPDLTNDSGSPPQFEAGAFGDLDGMSGGTLGLTYSTPLPAPLNFMVLGSANIEDPDSAQYLIGGVGADWLRFGIRNGVTIMGPSFNFTNRGYKRVPSGPNVYDTTIDEQFNYISRVGGQYLTRQDFTSEPEPFTGFRIGDRTGTAGTQWRGTMGVALIRQDNDNAAICRMRNLLYKLGKMEFPEPDFYPETRIYSENSFGEAELIKGDPTSITNQVIMSMTKMINALTVREWLTEAQLQDQVTIIENDYLYPGSGAAGPVKAGDVVKVIDLLHAAAMPSNDTAPRALARYVGGFMPARTEAISTDERFLLEMNDNVAEWGYSKALVTAVGGGAMLSPEQVTDVLRRIGEDPILQDVYSTEDYDIIVTGPNARTESISSNIMKGDPAPVEYAWGKGGSGSDVWGMSWAWNHPDGTVHRTAMLSVDTKIRSSGNWEKYQDLYAAIEAVKSGRFYNKPAQAMATGGFGPTTRAMSITELLPGMTANGASVPSGVWLTRSGDRVTLEFYDVSFTGSTFQFTSVLPEYYRPEKDMSFIIARGSTPFRLRVSELGTINSPEGMPSSGMLYGQVSWDVLVGKEFPGAPIPGVPWPTRYRTLGGHL